MRIPNGRAHKVGNPHFAKVSLKSYSDAHLHFIGASGAVGKATDAPEWPLSSRRAPSGRFRGMSLMLLGCLLAAWPAVALGQQEAPAPPSTTAPTPAPPVLSPELFERLGKMEERLDRLSKQNESLRRENHMLT